MKSLEEYLQNIPSGPWEIATDDDGNFFIFGDKRCELVATVHGFENARLLSGALGMFKILYVLWENEPNAEIKKAIGNTLEAVLGKEKIDG